MMNVSREAYQKIESYLEFLLQSNKRYNLTSRKFEKFLHSHIEDSIALMTHIKDKNIHLVDLGSGQGLVGIILSILGIRDVTLIEASQKKSYFLSQACKFSDNKIMILNKFITNRNFIECDILVARAYGKLSKILRDTSGFEVRGKYLLIKGANLKDEIYEAEKTWQFSYDIYNISSSDHSKIIELSDIRRNKDIG